ncbi:MAG: non-homologous end-joining DNA ligase [Candidatus Hadarchaeales archaeon]
MQPLNWMEAKLSPMLAHSAEPFDSPEFVFEPKFDGTRCLAFVGEGLRLQNRRLLDITGRYPELAPMRKRVRAREAILDGEIVVMREGRPDFRLLQVREHGEARREILSGLYPASYACFDLLYQDGEPLVHLPLLERKRRLAEIIEEGEEIFLVRHYPERGRWLFQQFKERGWEGIMGKRASSTYQLGKRSRDWLKIKDFKTLDCVILGYTPGEGRREDTFGALVLGAYKDGRLIFVGRVGTGFDEPLLRELKERLDGMRGPKPIAEEIPLEVTWVRPELVCEVQYLEITPDLKLRAPSFRKLREDKEPAECELTPPEATPL